MAEFWLIVDPVDRSQRLALWQDYLKNYALPDALTLAQVLTKQDPKNGGYRVSLGKALYAHGRLVEARAELLLALKLDPNQPQAYKALSSVFRRLNDPGMMQRALEAAVALDPGDFQTRSNLGMIYLKGGKYGLAVQHLEIANQLAPGEARIRQFLEAARTRASR